MDLDGQLIGFWSLSHPLGDGRLVEDPHLLRRSSGWRVHGQGWLLDTGLQKPCRPAARRAPSKISVGFMDFVNPSVGGG